MLRRTLEKFVTIGILILISTTSCGGNNGEGEIAKEEIPTITPQVSIEILDGMRPETREIKVEIIPQNNCGGTAEVENEESLSRSIAHTMEVGAGLEVNANGQIGFAGTDVELGATIAGQLGYSYGSVQDISRSITVKARPGTYMEHRVQLQEIWQIGTAKIVANDQEIQVPFNFRSDFRVHLLNSRDKGCPSNSSTGISTKVPIEETVANTPTPEPTATDTPTSEPTATDTPTPEPTATDTPTSEPTATDTSTPEPFGSTESVPFSIDLTPYSIGDIPKELGTDLVIGDRDGRVYVSGLNDGGRIEIRNISLLANFEVVFDADWGDFSTTLLLRSSSGDEISLRFDGDDITFGNTQKHFGDTGWKGGDVINNVRLTVNGDTAKVFVNEVFFGATPVKPNAEYISLAMTGIKRKDYLFLLKGAKLPQRTPIGLDNVVNRTADRGSFSLDLNPYEIGDIARELGTNLMVNQLDGRKYLTGFVQNGKFEIANLNLKENFEISFDADWSDFTSIFKLESDNKEEIEINFEGDNIIFGNTDEHFSNTSWKGGNNTNEIRLSVAGDTAKVFINGEFFGTTLVNPNTIYTKLVINGLKTDDYLFSVRGSNF